MKGKQMKLIDSDALFRAMENAGWYNNSDRDEVAERLVLDAPEAIVRCKDCIYWRDKLTDNIAQCDYISASKQYDHYYYSIGYTPISYQHIVYREAEDYCSGGRKRDE